MLLQPHLVIFFTRSDIAIKIESLRTSENLMREVFARNDDRDKEIQTYPDFLNVQKRYYDCRNVLFI